MSSSGMEDDLTCALCMEKYDKKDRLPKSLPCLHAFCLGCLELFLEHHKEKDTLDCPTCRESFPLPENGVNDFRTHFMLIRLLDEAESKAQKDDVMVKTANPQEAQKVKATLTQKLSDEIQKAKGQVNDICRKVEEDLQKWQTEMIKDIDKIDQQIQDKIEKEYNGAADDVKKRGTTIEATPLYSYVTSPISVNCGLRLQKVGASSGCVVHAGGKPKATLPAPQESEPFLVNPADVKTRNTMTLPYSSYPTLSVSDNGLVLVTLHHGQKVFLYEYGDGYYKHQKSFELEPGMQGAKALLTPDGKRIILCKTFIVKAGWFTNAQSETKTWIMNLQMELVSEFSGDIGELLSVTDSRLLYKQNDVCGTVLSVFNFKHRLVTDVVQKSGDGRTVLNAVLNPETHAMAVLVQKGRGRQVIVYDHKGNMCREIWCNHEFVKLTHGNKDFIVLSDKEGVYFYSWGHKSQLRHTLKFSEITFAEPIASFPPEHVCQSQDKNRIMHILSRETLFLRSRLTACRVDF